MSLEYWMRELERFFESRADSLVEVLDAANCREAWLQAEMFRSFRHSAGLRSFSVNTLPIGPRKNADFSADDPSRVVGEVKILGWDYFTKDITGGSIRPIMDRLDRPITASDRDLVLGPWGLIVDFFRLVDFADRDRRDAILVLVVDERSQYDRSLARALRQINFVRPSRDVRYAAGLIRLWSLPNGASQVIAEQSIGRADWK